MDNKNFEEMKRIYGEKVSNLYMLEQNGFKVPPFMYVDENYIEQKEWQFVKFKKNINRRFIPGVIIQQMIPNKIISEININNNKIIIKQKNKKNKMFYFFYNVNKIKINVNKEYNNKLIKIIKKIKKLNLDFENLNLKLFLFNWYSTRNPLEVVL